MHLRYPRCPVRLANNRDSTRQAHLQRPRGRSGRFSDHDLAPLHSYQRLLQALVPACVGLAPAPAPTPRWSRVTTPSPLSRLTAREGQILHWVRAGKRDPEIGLILEISPRTVHHHLASVYRKLGVETRTAAARLQ